MKRIALFVALLSLFVLSAHAREFAGVTIPEQLQYAGKTMQLNGVGMRKKLFLSLYAGSLYLEEKSSDANKIINEDTPMAVQLNITSSLITPDKMKEATLKGFKKSTKGNLEPIQPKINELFATFDKGVSSGDWFQLINVPGSGVHVIRNGVRVAVIRSLPFKQALFGIWLSDNPVDAGLKRRMLGI